MIRMFFISGIILLTICSCDKEVIPEFSGFVEGYIVGTFICDEDISENGQGTGSKTDRGFCILLEGSENTDFHWPMDFYTFNLPSGLFDFPDKILTSTYDGTNCGPVFSPDSIKYEYKLRFRYREPKKSERIFFTCGPCMHIGPTFHWEKFKEVIIKEVTINKLPAKSTCFVPK